MLQRAASNAYSWWWASHVRTKQSKWLEQSLQDMEEKVQHVIKLIEEDGDSFAKRAEMYYKKRPELLHFVEESYRDFRALAERYDHLSNDLQKANHAIATVFPEQVQFAMDEEDELGAARIQKNFQVPAVNMENIPKVPKAPIKDSKGPLPTALKQLSVKKSLRRENTCKTVAKSGLSNTEALEEIDKLQKDILALQTVKEYVKCSHEISLEKYWGIENQIIEMQQKVCSLQDEFCVDTVIEDDEARTLMAEAALRSCQETLAQLQEKQERSNKDAKEEYEKIEDVCQRLKYLRHEYLCDETDVEKPTESESSTEEVDDVIQERRENVEVGPMASLTVTELAEKVDEVVNKVINLETAVSSQTVLTNRLRTEVDDLQTQIRNLEDEKEILADGTHDLRSRLKDMEEKLNIVRNLNKNVDKQNSNLHANFTEACYSLDHLSEKLSSVKLDDELDVANLLQDEERPVLEMSLWEDLEEKNIMSSPDSVVKNLNTTETGNGIDVKQEGTKEQSLEARVHDQQGEDKETIKVEVQDDLEEKNMSRPDNGVKNLNTTETENGKDAKEDTKEQSLEAYVRDQQGDSKETTKESVILWDAKPQEQVSMVQLNQTGNDLPNTEEYELDWQQKLLSGMGDRDKILLTEYTTILRNYKDVKRKLTDMEKNDRDKHAATTVHVRELQNAIAKRDKEIQNLRQILNASEDRSVKPEAGTEVSEADEDDVVKLVLIDRAPAISAAEEKLRMDIDAILEENLDFWLRFSTAFHLIQKFRTEVQDLHDEISKVEKKKHDGSIRTDLKSELRPIYKHLREIQTELSVWLEQSVLLKEELSHRFASLCSIQEDITVALKEGVEEEEIRFSSHQAAKFQGEVLNMKQENNKVQEELQVGLDHVNALRLEIEKTLGKLNEEFEVPGDQPQLSHSDSRSRIPLRSFIFGTRQKKQKYSIFSALHHYRRSQILRDDAPM